MTAETTGANPLVASDVLTGGARRLNPMDGLLLRAEHLVTMQDYALALATGVGRSGGAGVDFGYQLGVSTDHAGLDALDPARA